MTDCNQCRQTDVGLIIAAAGSSRRFSAAENKVLLPLNGMPVFLHSLLRFLAVIPAENTVLVVQSPDEAAFRAAMAAAGVSQRVRLVAGGATRQQSVGNGLAALPLDVRLAAVHDAARPCAGIDVLLRCIESARQHGSGVAAHPVSDTVKRVDSERRVLETLPREALWAAETPQVFARNTLMEALKAAEEAGIAVTDEAQAVEFHGGTVMLVPSHSPNPKLTYAADRAFLEALVIGDKPVARGDSGVVVQPPGAH